MHCWYRLIAHLLHICIKATPSRGVFSYSLFHCWIPVLLAGRHRQQTESTALHQSSSSDSRCHQQVEGQILTATTTTTTTKSASTQRSSSTGSRASPLSLFSVDHPPVQLQSYSRCPPRPPALTHSCCSSSLIITLVCLPVAVSFVWSAVLW